MTCVLQLSLSMVIATYNRHWYIPKFPYWYISKRSRHMVMCQWPRKKSITSVLFTETANLLFQVPCISITTEPTSIQFTEFMPSICMTSHTKFKENQLSSLENVYSWKWPNFLHSCFLCTVLNTCICLSQPKMTFLWINFFQI